MKRHLKVRAVLTEDKKEVIMSVLSCTATGERFGGNCFGVVPEVFVHKGVKLRARLMPFSMKDDAYGARVDEDNYFAVSMGADPNGVTVVIPVDRWPEVKEAIVAYNSDWKEDSMSYDEYCRRAYGKTP